MFDTREKPGTDDEQIAALREAIQCAFPVVTYTGQVTDHDGAWLPELTEENAIHDDDKFVYEALKGRKWIDVPKQFLYDEPDGFVLLTDEALVAFLAAWLVGSLDDINGENKIREFLVYSFSPGPAFQSDSVAFKVRKLRALSIEQRSVLRLMLMEFAKREASSFIRANASEGVALIDGLDANSRQ